MTLREYASQSYTYRVRSLKNIERANLLTAWHFHLVGIYTQHRHHVKML